MAIRGEVLFKGIQGERKDDSSVIYAFSQSCSMPMDQYTGIPTGSRKYDAFMVQKEIDRATPELWKALTTGQTLETVTITLYQIAKDTGTETAYFKFTLKSARITAIHDYMPTTFEDTGNAIGHLEEIFLVANEYEWENILAKTQNVDENFFNQKA